LMGSEGHMSKGAWRGLRRLSVQENRGAGRFSSDRQSGQLLNGLELQMQLWSHSFADLNVLLKWFIVLQSGSDLMGSEGHMSKGAWRGLRRLSVQENRGAGRFSSDRQSGQLLNGLELQMQLWNHSFADLNVLLKWFIVLQSGSDLMGSEGHMSKGAWRGLRRLSVQENRGAGRFSSDRQSGQLLNGLELQMQLWNHSFAD